MTTPTREEIERAIEHAVTRMPAPESIGHQVIVWRGQLETLIAASRVALELMDKGSMPLAEWVEKERQCGLMLGALEGLRFCVDDETKRRIDNVLSKVTAIDAARRGE